MKNPIRAANGRQKSVPTTDNRHSTTEQLAIGENEGMLLAKENSAKKSRPASQAETTSLERRVLAHERILQSLIAHMAETNHGFLQRLQETFGLPNKFREQDYTDTDDFAEEFVRAIEEAVQRQIEKVSSQKKADDGRQTAPRTAPEHASAEPERDRFKIKNRNGIWEVKENGTFLGDFLNEKQAIDAVEKAKRTI